ncbi:FkbM family methyltransferase [Candidatus Peregrinibacteria bacterium]|nr:FkbM family methyltransferase [Candidatus Peregrinibacteria bacterium]
MKEIRTNFYKKNIKIFLRDDADRSVYSEIFEDFDYRIVEESIKKSKNCIVDIGAHIGLFSIYAAVLNPEIGIFCFEPEPQNFSLLKKNIKENRLKNIYPASKAISDRNDICELFLSEDSHNHSLCTPSQNSMQVPASTINRIFQKNKIEKCELLKIDTEGGEYAILESLPRELAEKIDTIYIEYHELNNTPKKNHLINILNKLGYKVSSTPSHYQQNLGFILARKA